MLFIKKRGFTLIELLAVIIILVVIVVMAIPVVLDVINDAKVSARKSTLVNYADAVKNKATTEYFNNGGSYSGCIDLNEVVNNNSVSCDEAYYTNDNKVMLGNCAIENSNENYWYIDGTVIDSKPDNFDLLKTNSLISNVCHQKQSTPESCFTFDSSSGAITGYDAGTCESDVTIPSTIGGYTVSSVADNAFSNKGLTSVTIPDSVTTIGERAFYFNTSMTSINIGKNVNEIKSWAFGVMQLTELIIPGNVEMIGENAFAQNHLTSLIINEGIKFIGSEAFANSGLTNVTIPNSVTYLSGFNGNNLTNITIPSSVEEIGGNAFSYNKLTNVNISNNVNFISGSAFANNNILQGNVTIDNNVSGIEIISSAFENNGPDGKTTITPTYLR